MDKKKCFQWNELTMGVCYYPEHWDKGLWESDLKRMKEAGISVIRIAEFSWNKVEPEEGRFDFSFFDEFLDLCLRYNINVIYCTPTATPPAWLTEKYPDVLNTDINGTAYRHGGRRHYNYNSEVYRRLCARIVEKEAEHYGGHPAVIGWQIDNELNCETDLFYSKADDLAFRKFLKEKYQTLDALNSAWGTAFWNETYTDWSEVHILRPVLNYGFNPHQHLDYIRFISESVLGFCRMQSNIIRKYKNDDVFITTNGLFGNMDNHKMMEESLDTYMYDSYPNFAYGLDRDPKNSNDLNDRKWSRNLIETRSVCPHFSIMEQQSGANGWTTRMEGPAPRPGQLTLWAMQSVAHGADMVSFFRWRTCAMGTEMYWHGILDYDNRDNRKLSEVKDFYTKLKKIDEVCGAGHTASFALIKDYDNEWDMSVDKWHKIVASASAKEIFNASQIYHTPYDIVYINDATEAYRLSAYPVIIYPHPVIMTEKRAELLRQYVMQGGKLVIGCRSGYKDITGKAPMMPQPGLLKDITGSDVVDFSFASPAEELIRAADLNTGEEIEMPVFNDIMETGEEGEVLAEYKNGYFAGKAAVIRKKCGKGETIHFGSTFSAANLKWLFGHTGIYEPFADIIEAPAEIETVLREKDGARYMFLLNYEAREAEYELKQPASDLISGRTDQGKRRLQPYGVAVYRLQVNHGDGSLIDLIE